MVDGYYSCSELVSDYNCDCSRCRCGVADAGGWDGVECEAVRFYEVDAGAARVLHALANIQKLPAVHVYKSGELLDTRSVHTPALWEECAESIALHAADFGP